MYEERNPRPSARAYHRVTENTENLPSLSVASVFSEHTAKMFPHHRVTENTENLLFLSVASVPPC